VARFHHSAAVDILLGALFPPLFLTGLLKQYFNFWFKN
jgi:hypothetical protein